MYIDTQTQGLDMGKDPLIFQDGLGILGVHRYSDTGCYSWVDILGLPGMVWVSLVYTDTQTQGLDMGGDPRIF